MARSAFFRPVARKSNTIAMRPLFARCAAAALAAAIPARAASSTSNAFNVTLDATKIEESCIRLEKGESARYQWKSDVPVDFNIHYHEGNEIFYPVKKNGATGGKDTFKAKIAQDYCWMWTATRQTKLEGRVEK
jgi:hypothetical protein